MIQYQDTIRHVSLNVSSITALSLYYNTPLSVSPVIIIAFGFCLSHRNHVQTEIVLCTRLYVVKRSITESVRKGIVRNYFYRCSVALFYRYSISINYRVNVYQTIVYRATNIGTNMVGTLIFRWNCSKKSKRKC